MRRLFYAFVFMIAAGSGVAAQTYSFHSSALPYDLFKASCDDIIAHTFDGRETMLMAAHLYAKGLWHGDHCIKQDYVKAYELYMKAGEPGAANQIIARLQGRADKSPSARAALRKLRKAGYID